MDRDRQRFLKDYRLYFPWLRIKHTWLKSFCLSLYLKKYILCWVRSATQVILTNQLLHWHVHLFIGNGHVAQTDFTLTKDFEIDWQNVTSRHVHFNRCIHMGNLGPIQKGPQARVHVSHGEVATVVLFWSEYEKYLMWQKKNVAEFPIEQCKWEQEKELCNERIANPKKGEAVCFVAFR